MKRLILLVIFTGLSGPAFADDPPEAMVPPAPPAPPPAPAPRAAPAPRPAPAIPAVPPVPVIVHAPRPPRPPRPPVAVIPPTPVLVVPAIPGVPYAVMARNDDDGDSDDDDKDDDFDFDFDTDNFMKTFEAHIQDVPFVDKDELRRIAREARDEAREHMREARKTMAEARQQMREQIREQTEQAREQAQEEREQAREQVREQMERVREQLEHQRELMREQRHKWHDKSHDCDNDEADDDDDDDDDDMDDQEVEAPMPPMPPRPPRAAMASPNLPPAKDGTASLKVAGPVSFHLENAHGDVDISAGTNTEVSISGPGCAPGNVQFDRSDNEVEAELDVEGCRGPLRVRLPSGSKVNVSAMTGNITLHGVYADVELEAVSGNISVDRAADASLSTVGGNLVLRDATGRVKAETVGGNATISMSGSSPRLEFESVSGNLVWSGLCGRGCRLATETFSGTTELKLDPRSSFNFRYSSRGGNVTDELGIKTDGDRGRNQVRGVFGSGDGVVTSETYRGNVRVTRR